jgi:2-haloacid dehalogenase
MNQQQYAPSFISFDCYDTLVEFKADDVTRDLLADRAASVDMESLLADFEVLRYATTTYQPYQPYRDVLRHTLRQIMERYGIPYRAEDGEAFLAAVRTWGPFPDVPPALERLRAAGITLVILTNSDDDLMAENVARIGVPIDVVITAEQAGAYKPNLPAFQYMLDRLGCQPEELLHVAQGFEYDIVPAHALGWNRVWINRYGKTGDPAYSPYGELPDLSGLPDLVGA